MSILFCSHSDTFDQELRRLFLPNLPIPARGSSGDLPVPGGVTTISRSLSSIGPVFFFFAFRAANTSVSIFSNSAHLSSNERSKKLSLTYNPRFSSGSSLSMLQSLNTHLVNASCSVPWSMSSVHFTNSQRSKRVNDILPRKLN